MQSTDTLNSLEPQFHLQSLGNASNPDIVFFRLLGFEQKLDLFALRVKLVVFNLLVLGASVMAYQGWIWVDEIKRDATIGLSQAEKDRDPFNIPNQWLHAFNYMIAHGFADADGVLFGCAASLMISYVLFGSFISLCKYGKSFHYTKLIVYTAPLNWILGAFVANVAYHILALRIGNVQF